MRGLVVGLGSSPLGLGASPSPLPSEQCVRVEACACRSTAARGWHCDEGCARPRRARHRAYQRQLSRHGNAYPGSSSEPGRRRRDATAAHSTSSARCPALSPAARSDGRRSARCSAPWPQTEEFSVLAWQALGALGVRFQPLMQEKKTCGPSPCRLRAKSKTRNAALGSQRGVISQ